MGVVVVGGGVVVAAVVDDTISAHDVSVKILRRFRAEHSFPHHKFFFLSVLCAVLLLGSLAHLVFINSRGFLSSAQVVTLVSSTPSPS